MKVETLQGQALKQSRFTWGDQSQDNAENLFKSTKDLTV